MAVRCWLIASNQFEYIKIVYATRKKTDERRKKNDKVNTVNSRAQDEILCLYYCMNCNWFEFFHTRWHSCKLLTHSISIETKTRNFMYIYILMHFFFIQYFDSYVIISREKMQYNSKFTGYGKKWRKKQKKTNEQTIERNNLS